jgi:hypothetical protein
MGTVAAGALVVGTSLLVVFALATQALDYQLESSLNELENSNEPPPSMRFTKVQNIEEAVVEITITDRGEDIVCAGTCQLRLGTGGAPPSVGDFTAEFTLQGATNEVDTVTITNHGSYLYTTTSSLTLFADVSSSTTPPAFTFDVQTIVYANVKNVGVTNIDTSEAWVTVDGANVFQFDDLLNFEDGPTNQLTINSSDPFPIMYPGEVFTIQHLTGVSFAKERITLVSDGVIAASDI